MNRFKKACRTIILISLMTLFLSLIVFAQIEPYDPSKEPSFDKEQLLKELKEMVSTKHPSLVDRYILDTYIKPERYQAAIFLLESLKNIPEFDQRSFMRDELCLCYLFSGRINKDNAMDCLRKIYLSYMYPRVDLDKVSPEKKNQILEKSDYNVIYGPLMRSMSGFREDRIIPFIEEQIDNFLAKYKDISSREREFLTRQKYLFERNREDRKLAEQRKALRKKQILEYIKELEILLVARDEQKLSEFLSKYVVADMQKFFLERYIKRYFHKNYSEVHFELIADSTGESIHLTGMEEEITSVDFIVRTIPESEGKECPEVVHSNNIDLYCQGFINFKFKQKKMFVD